MKEIIVSALVMFLLCQTTRSVAGERESAVTFETNGFALADFENENAGKFSIVASDGFTENKGQVGGHDGLSHPEIKFTWQRPGAQLFLLTTGLAYQFTKTHYPDGYAELIVKLKNNHRPERLEELQKEIRTETYRMDMELVGANPDARISTEGKSNDFVNYYNRQITDVRSYNKVIYHEVYPGIDWVVYTNNGEIKYDFIVRPGADPAQIQLKFEHQETLSLNKNGSITLGNPMGTITEKNPTSYQDGREIFSEFVLKGNQVSFRLQDYDKSKTLVIDPAIAWATYYGGDGADAARSCVTDATGDVFFAGMTTSSLAIAAGGYQNVFGGSGNFDAYIARFTSSGLRIWASYYGGAGNDYGNWCAVDASGSIYLTGETWSSANTASNGHQGNLDGPADAFLAKFAPNGGLLWATYYGGPGLEVGYSCATDYFGSVYLAGQSNSAFNISSGGYQNAIGGAADAFLVKFNSNGVRLWATYYGGTLTDGATGCATDSFANVYLSGSASSTTGIASGGHQNVHGGGNSDAFLVKFDGNGMRLWATYYGGDNTDLAYGCATDTQSNVYVFGATCSYFNIGSGGFQNTYYGPPNSNNIDAYLVKFNTGGQRIWGTYYGNEGNDLAYSCAADAVGNVYLAGTTSSTANIAYLGYQNVIGNNTVYPDDAFLVKFDINGLRQWGTYYGGSHVENATGVAVGPYDAVYIAGATSSTTQIAYLGFQNTLGGSPDSFVAKFCNDVLLPFVIDGPTSICPGVAQVYSVTADPNAVEYTWSLPGGWGGSSGTNSIQVIPSTSGNISLYVANGCGAGTTQTLNVPVYPALDLSVTASSSLICSGQTVTLSVLGASSYTWNQGQVNNPIVISPSGTSSFTVSSIGAGNCTTTADFQVTVNVCAGTQSHESPELQVKIYPNPSGSVFTIENETPARIKLYNATGGLVYEKADTKISEQIDLSDYAKGVYYLQVQVAEGSRMFKLVYQ